MRAKEFFRQVAIAEAELKVIRAKISHYEALGMPSGGIAGSCAKGSNRNASRVEIGAIAAADALTDLEHQLKLYEDIVTKAEHIIRQIPQVKYRQLLSYHYVCGKSLRWVSDELDYTDPNSVYRAHGWALAAAQKIMDQEASEI
jgi:hypothetical protein